MAERADTNTVNTIVVEVLKACSFACDRKDKASCDVLENNTNTWNSLAELAPLDRLCDRSASPSLRRELCDALIAARPKP